MTVGTQLMYALQAIYFNRESCVKLNDHMTDWFDVNTGIQQVLRSDLSIHVTYLNY